MFPFMLFGVVPSYILTHTAFKTDRYVYTEHTHTASPHILHSRQIDTFQKGAVRERQTEVDCFCVDFGIGQTNRLDYSLYGLTTKLFQGIELFRFMQPHIPGV